MEPTKALPQPPIYTAKPAESTPTTSSYAQDVLLKALADGITDPKELAKLASLKKTADVYTVLDKLSLRKEFHAALARADVSLDFLVGRLKKICENPNDETALKGISTVLKTIGLDKHEEDGTTGKAWEDVVLENAVQMEETSPGHYEVAQPKMPESLMKKKEEEKASGKSLYERKADTGTPVPSGS